MVPEGFYDIQNCSIVKDTYPERDDEGAYIVQHEDLGRISIPKSNVHNDSELPMAPEHATMYVAEWFVELKGWDKKL